MQRSGELTIRIAEGNADPDTRELAEFIMLLRAAYNAGIGIERATDSATSPRALASLLRSDLAERNARATNELFDDRRRDALRTRRVSHESPLDIVLWGVLVPIAGAVILAGGKVTITLSKFEAELPRGLGEFIAALRNAFAPKTKAELGYGVQEREVKLSREEFEELMRHDPATRDKGGFQRKLVEFQSRTHRTRRTLTLYPADIDWILRHGSQPEKGGWQQSIRRIFGRHFTLKQHERD
jgi:hypothetical protein